MSTRPRQESEHATSLAPLPAAAAAAAAAHLEQVPRVEQPRVNAGGRPVAQAHDKDLGGRVAGRCGLGSLHPLKQLVEGVQQRIVVLRLDSRLGSRSGQT
jgi:hypothetical protein